MSKPADGGETTGGQNVTVKEYKMVPMTMDGVPFHKDNPFGTQPPREIPGFPELGGGWCPVHNEMASPLKYGPDPEFHGSQEPGTTDGG